MGVSPRGFGATPNRAGAAVEQAGRWRFLRCMTLRVVPARKARLLGWQTRAAFGATVCPMGHNLNIEADLSPGRLDWLPLFDPHPLYRGGVIQTLSIKTVRADFSLDDWPGCREIEVEGTEQPPDTLGGYWLPASGDRRRGMTVLVMHGMGGDAGSNYMLSAAGALLRSGHDVLLWNHRGAGKTGSTCRKLHHPGATDDVQLILNHLAAGQIGDQQPVAAMAFSLGASLLLRYLAEDRDDNPLTAAVAVSPPLDLAITSRSLHEWRNRPFERYLLHQKRNELLREAADLTERERQTLRGVRTIWDLDDQVSAPHLGYDGAEAFYAEVSAIERMDQIRTPTLMIHALDDPVVDPQVFEGRDWQSGNELFPVMLPTGGHTGFIQSDGTRWHEAAAVAMFERAGGQGNQRVP